MRNWLRILYFVLTICLLGCTNSNNKNEFEKFELYSKWQCLNDPNFVIEFTPDNQYIVYRDKNKIFSLNCIIDKKQKDKYDFTCTFNNDSLPIKGIIELVTSDRIRVYIWKHHDILRMADEFYRTNNLTSFDSIYKEIWRTPE
jgi:hypothetical protein